MGILTQQFHKTGRSGPTVFGDTLHASYSQDRHLFFRCTNNNTLNTFKLRTEQHNTSAQFTARHECKCKQRC